MKKYPKTHEGLFAENRSLRHCKLEKVEISKWEKEELYHEFFGTFLKGVFSGLWMTCIRIYWMINKFKYNGKIRKMSGSNGFELDRAMSVYMRQYVGRDVRVITRSYFFGKLSSYFEELFPNFHENDPFTNPELYEFPYKNIDIDHLLVVYQMPERIEHLEYADKVGLKYNQFLDYLFNYVHSYNEDVGEVVYGFANTRISLPYIKYYKNKHGKRT